MDFSHIMLDLETLDVKPSAVVVSIGAVAFDPASPAIGEQFYAELTIPSNPSAGYTGGLTSQMKLGRTIGGDTAQWWLQQSSEAQAAFVASPAHADRFAPEHALMLFAQFIARNGGKDAQIWGNGSDFDNVILGSMYETYGIQRPWSYSKNRCFRTINALPKDKNFVKPEREGVHHHALDDALYQARVLQEIVKCLGLL